MSGQVISKITKYSTEIRKKARQQFFSNRRYRSHNNYFKDKDYEQVERKKRIIIDQQNRQIISEIINQHFQLDDLPEFIERFENCDNLQLLLHSMIGIKKILMKQSMMGQGQIGLMVLSQNQGIEKITQKLKTQQNIQLKFQALQIMGVISNYDDYCAYLLQFINFKHILELLNSNIYEISQEIILIIGNIALTSHSQFLTQIINHIIRLNNPYLYTNSIWLINIYVSKIFQNSHHIIHLQMIIQYVCSNSFFNKLFSSDQQSMIKYLWTLNYLSQLLPQKTINSIIQLKIHLRIIQQLNKENQYLNNSINLVKATILIKLLGFVSTIQNGDIQLLQNNILQCLRSFIKYDYQYLKQQIYYLLSNLAASSNSKIFLNHQILNQIFKFRTSQVSEHLFWFCSNLQTTCQQIYHHHHIMLQINKIIGNSITTNKYPHQQNPNLSKFKF